MSPSEGFSLPVLKAEADAPMAAFEALLGGAAPSLPAFDDGPGSEEAGWLLGQVLAALRQGPAVFSLEGISPDAHARLAEVLGEGEVSFTVSGTRVFRINETRLPGVWRVEDVAPSGAVRGEFLEVADVPSVVRAANAEATCGELSIGAPPAGTMNVLPVLAELRHRMKGWKPGAPNHVISFTLLPMNELDMRTLEAQLGHGPVVAESRGYGSCKVELTGHRNLWSVQFFNRAGAVILDTLEIGDVPVALTAAREDFEDSAERLSQLLGGA